MAVASLVAEEAEAVVPSKPPPIHLRILAKNDTQVRKLGVVFSLRIIRFTSSHFKIF